MKKLLGSNITLYRAFKRTKKLKNIFSVKTQYLFDKLQRNIGAIKNPRLFKAEDFITINQKLISSNQLL